MLHRIVTLSLLALLISLHLRADNLLFTLGVSGSTLDTEEGRAYALGVDGSVAVLGFNSTRTNVFGAYGDTSYPSFPVFWIGGAAAAVRGGDDSVGYLLQPEAGLWAFLCVGAGYRFSRLRGVDSEPYLYVSLPWPNTSVSSGESPTLLYYAPFVRIPFMNPSSFEAGLMVKMIL